MISALYSNHIIYYHSNVLFYSHLFLFVLLYCGLVFILLTASTLSPTNVPTTRPTALGNPFTVFFNYTGRIINWTAPYTAEYNISCSGAQGGNFCQSKHLSTTTWSPVTAAATSCAYGNSGIRTYSEIGAMSWKQCLSYASQYGAMLFGRLAYI
jgi:hypothetical protein